MDKLLTLLSIERQAQEARTLEQSCHILANQIPKLVPVIHALIWIQSPLGSRLQTISGNVVLDEKGPYAIAILDEIKSLSLSDVTEKTETRQNKQTGTYLTFIPLITEQEGYMGGVVLETNAEPSEDQKRLIEELSATCAPIFALQILRKEKGWGNKISAALKINTPKKMAVICALVIAVLFPVRSTITAPVEIVPKNADYLTSGESGLIATVSIEPGAVVKTGDILVELDDTVLKAEMDLAQQTLEMAKASLSRIQRESLTAPEKKSGLSQIESEINEKEIRLSYALKKFENTKIKATRNGIAIFASKDALEGKPVQAGDVLMKLASPEDADLLIKVPVEQMIPLDRTAKVNFFLNVEPTTTREANIKSIGYEASTDEDGLSTYKIKAEINQDTKDPMRIGWQGIAKIKTEWTILGLDILRKPILFFRRISGI